MDTVNEKWVCPNCGTQRSLNIKLIDGPAVKCYACRFVYVFTSFQEACENGWRHGWKLGHKDTTRELPTNEFTGMRGVYIQKLEEENKDLRKTGQTLCNRVHDVLDGIIDESALLDALEKWEKAKEGAGC